MNGYWLALWTTVLVCIILALSDTTIVTQTGDNVVIINGVVEQ